MIPILFAVLLAAPADNAASQAQASILQHDGSRDFDFLIGDWRAHVRRLPERLVGSNAWVEYDGISNHHKLLDTNANFEEFDVKTKGGELRIKAQTLRMYNPETHQWSIYGLELDKGSLETPPLVGSFASRGGISSRLPSGAAMVRSPGRTSPFGCR